MSYKPYNFNFEFAPNADVVIYKTDSKIVAKAWDENHEKWKRIAQGSSGISDDDPRDDTTIIKKALHYDKIFLYSGTYFINDTLILKSNNQILGLSPNNTVLKLAKYVNKNMITNESYSSNTSIDSNISICNITLDGNGDYQSAQSSCIEIANISGLKLKNVKMINGYSYCLHSNSNVENACISDCICDYSINDPAFAGQWLNSTIIGSIARNSLDNGFNFWGCANINVISCISELNSGYGGFKTEANCSNINFIGCSSINNSGHGFVITKTSNFLLNGCISNGNQIGLLIRYGSKYGSVVSGYYSSNSNDGIQLWEVSGVESDLWVENIYITNSFVLNNNGYGIRAIGSSNRIYVIACNVSGNNNGNILLNCPRKIAILNSVPTISFKYNDNIVELGNAAYGSPTIITSQAGFISSFDLILHITAAAGDTVNAKITTVFENAGETTGIVKTLDNSAGTASISQDVVLDINDKLALWVDNDRLLQIKVYGESATGAAGSSLTFDVFGSS